MSGPLLTGSNGLLAVSILDELFEALILSQATTSEATTVQRACVLDLLSAYVNEGTSFPVLWGERQQSILQQASTSKIYSLLDDIEEDFESLNRVLWGEDRDRYPPVVETEAHGTVNLYDEKGWKWAVCMAMNSGVFIEGKMYLPPVFDCFQRPSRYLPSSPSSSTTIIPTLPSEAIPVRKLTGKHVEIRALSDVPSGSPIVYNHGPKSAADYLLDHGTIPSRCYETRVAEIEFEIDPNDRFYDDKVDILQALDPPLTPRQKFDVVSGGGSSSADGRPDDAMLQFLRLVQLSKDDAFLLEPVFRNDVWGFMAEPVSERNENDCFSAILDFCSSSMEDKQSVEKLIDPSDACEKLCGEVLKIEKDALKKLEGYVKRDREAMDLKSYYADRRLKELNLDQPYDFEENENLNEFGRLPGGGEIDF